MANNQIGFPISMRKPGIAVDIKQGMSTQVPLRIRNSSGTTLWQLNADGSLTLTAGAVASAALSETLVQYTSVTILAAAVATLRAAPVTLVAAPGAGKQLEFISAMIFLDYGGVAFTESTDNLQVKYVDGSGLACSQAIEMTGWITLTADAVTNALPKIDLIGTAAQVVNTALVLHNTGDGEFGGSGTSDLRVKVAYRVHTSGF